LTCVNRFEGNWSVIRCRKWNEYEQFDILNFYWTT